jgi:hypothetical protein
MNHLKMENPRKLSNMIACAFIFILFALKAVQANDKEIQKLCESKEICSNCIQIPHCAWCSDEAFENRTRCNPIKDYGNGECTKLTNPENSFVTTQNKLLSKEDRVQIQPQKISIKLRPSKIAI